MLVSTVACLCVGAVWLLLGQAKIALLGPTAEWQTGEQRRKLLPPGDQSTGYPPSLLPAGFEYALVEEHGFFDLKDGKSKLYWNMVAPKNKSAIDKVVFWVHGWTDHVGGMSSGSMKTMAALHNAAVIGCDLPGHGRSDGLHLYIPDWFDFCSAAGDFAACVVKEKAKALSSTSSPLRVFGMGESMGGGVLTTLCLQRPRLLDGVVLVYPMLDVGRETYPSPPVLFLFKHVLCSLLPAWPLTPSKDITSIANRDAAVSVYFRSLLFTAASTKPRIRSAYSLAFQAPAWIQARLPDMATPLLVLHGADDRVTRPEVSEHLHLVAKAADKTLKVYADAQHGELLHGKVREEVVREVYADVGQWMAQRC